MVKVEAGLTIIAGRSRRFREQKKYKKCFPPVEGPLESHFFLLRKREERGLKAGDG